MDRYWLLVPSLSKFMNSDSLASSELFLASTHPDLSSILQLSCISSRNHGLVLQILSCFVQMAGLMIGFVQFDQSCSQRRWL
jgi:hypothetical protein